MIEAFEEIYKERVEKLQSLMASDNIGGFLFTASPNLLYMTGFSEGQMPRFLSLLVLACHEPVFLVPALYEEQIREKTWVDTIVPWADGEDPFSKMRSLLCSKNLESSTIAVDDTLWSIFLLNLQERLPKAGFVSGGKYMKPLRRIKSLYEKELMMRIGAITDDVMEKTIAFIEPGISELCIVDFIQSELRLMGAGPSTAEPIVGSGPYSAQPHYRPTTEKLIQQGDAVVLDFGGTLNHYHSDMTRTVFVGEPDKEFQEIYDIVRKAHDAAMAFAKPGVKCEDIDSVARHVITESGYGEYFIHRTGHGIGLEVHEEPYVVQGNTAVLEPGMAFSIEPGIYIPGRYGVRIEDCVIVCDSGIEHFTKAPSELTVIW
ncbi:MAG: aminopeptidase P family protein [Firmicutes bacterium]|nr:aminopeptidase P family protein [Bacillota bacterium]